DDVVVGDQGAACGLGHGSPLRLRARNVTAHTLGQWHGSAAAPAPRPAQKPSTRAARVRRSQHARRVRALIRVKVCGARVEDNCCTTASGCSMSTVDSPVLEPVHPAPAPAPQPAAVPLPAAPAPALLPVADTYNDKVVHQFTVAAIVWGIVGMAVGVFIAAQLYWPAL